MISSNYNDMFKRCTKMGERMISRWGAVFLIFGYYNILGVTCLVQANLSSGWSLVPENPHDEEERSAAGQFTSNRHIRSPENADDSNFSQQEIRSRVIRSSDPSSEIYSDFKFVDSPDVTDPPPLSSGKDGGVVNRANGDNIGLDRRINYSSNKGAVESNLWKTYPNGTIIHDVRISLVHPANMMEVVNKGNSGDSDSVPTKGYSADLKINSERRAFPEVGDERSVAEQSILRHNGSLEDGKEASHSRLNPESVFSSTQPMVSSILAYRSSESSNLRDNTSEAATDVTISSSVATIGYGFTAPVNIEAVNATLITGDRENSSASPPSIVQSIVIDAKEPSLSECLSRCYIQESNVSSQYANSPLCLPPLFNKTRKDDLEMDGPGESLPANSSSSIAPLIDRKGDLEVGPIVDIGLLKLKNSLEPKFGFLLEDICLSESCVLKAADILRRMDKTVDPCESFYNFACGGYFNTELPYGESSKSIFSDISSDIVTRMNLILKSPVRVDDYSAIKLLKQFYGKCVGTSQKELLMDALRALGGWPSLSNRVPQHLWGEIAFNSTFDMFLEYNLVSINLTFADESDKWMLNVDYPQFVKVALSSGTADAVLNKIERDVKRLATALGIDDSIRGILGDVRIFMAAAIRYAKVTIPSAEKGVHSLRDLKARFTHLDVLKRLPSLLGTAIAIDDDEMIRVTDMMYLHKADDLVRDTTVTTQAGHIVLTALLSLSSLIGTTTTDTIIEKYCVKLTGKLFPHLDHDLYSSTFVSNSKVTKAKKIVSQIRDSLLHILDESNNTIHIKIMDKVKKLTFNWSNRLQAIADVDGIRRSFEENPSFLGFVKTGIWNLKKTSYAYLHQKVNNSLASFIERYTKEDFDVNAFYYSRNIFIPPSALHDSIFDPGLPSYANYGGLGLIVGHELIHSVMATGDFTNSAEYQDMQSCFINQFNKLPTGYSGKVNGVLTKDENIADHGGFKVAYHAFMEWYNYSSKESKEKRLPGLHGLNEKQMFWLTAATNWCQKVSPNDVPSSVDVHAPPEYRIDGQLSNIPEFAQDFHCPEDSLMNPPTKCSLL